MKTKKIQKPFTIEAWKNGAEVETRDGRPVRIFCTDMKGLYDIVGLAELDGAEVVMTWLANGCYLPPRTNPSDDGRDLVIVEEVEEVEEPERWAEYECAMGEGYKITDCATIGWCEERMLNGRHNFNLFATEKQALSALAMARISQLMAHDERYGGVVTDEEWKVIAKQKYAIVSLSNGDPCLRPVDVNKYFLAFHTVKQCDLFFRENEQLVKDYLMID